MVRPLLQRPSSPRNNRALTHSLLAQTSKTTRSTSKTRSPSRRRARATGSRSSPPTARRPSRPTAPQMRTSPSCRSGPRSTLRKSRRAAPAVQTPCKDPNQGHTPTHYFLRLVTFPPKKSKTGQLQSFFPDLISIALLLRPTQPTSSGEIQPGSDGRWEGEWGDPTAEWAGEC